MSTFPKDPFFDYYAHLKNVPDHVLRDIARNDAAGYDYRKHAVEVLMTRKYPVQNHPEFREFVRELEAELDGIEFEHPDPEVVEPNPGPLSASVTTKTMFSDGPVPETDTVDPEEVSQFSKPRPTEEQMDALIQLVKEEVIVPTPSPAPVPPKPKRTRKPKEPVDAPSE